VLGQRRGELRAAAREIFGQFRLGLIGGGKPPDTDSAGRGFAQLFQLRGQRLAVEKFQKMQMGRAAQRDHVAQRRGDPAGAQRGICPKGARRASHQSGKGRTKGAGRIKAGLMLRGDHLAALGQRLKPLAQATQPGHVQKSHPEMTPESPPHGGQIIAHLREIAFPPAPRRIGLECVKKCGDDWLGFGGGLHRMAAFTGTKPGLKAGPDRVVKGAVLSQRFARRAGQAAKNACGGYADKGLPVIARVAL